MTNTGTQREHQENMGMNILDIMKQALEALELSWVGNEDGSWDKQAVVFQHKAISDLIIAIKQLEGDLQ